MSHAYVHIDLKVHIGRRGKNEDEESGQWAVRLSQESGYIYLGEGSSLTNFKLCYATFRKDRTKTSGWPNMVIYYCKRSSHPRAVE